MPYNSTSRGDAFERRTHDKINALLLEGKLLVNPATSKIYQKKGYHSRDRGADIITDISIEVSYDGSEHIGLLIIIECKDYSHPVPVDDLEEFYAKVVQIAGLNVKAIFVTSAALQKSAFQYALSKKIAVIRLLPEDQMHFMMHLSVPNQARELMEQEYAFKNFQGGLFDQDHFSEFIDFYGVLDQQGIRAHMNIDSFFKQLIKNPDLL